MPILLPEVKPPRKPSDAEIMRAFAVFATALDTLTDKVKFQHADLMRLVTGAATALNWVIDGRGPLPTNLHLMEDALKLCGVGFKPVEPGTPSPTEAERNRLLAQIHLLETEISTLKAERDAAETTVRDLRSTKT